VPDTERLARALAEELRYTASHELRALVSAATAETDDRRNPAKRPFYLLARDRDWIALVERALEVADA
jgi:hypothetical protein